MSISASSGVSVVPQGTLAVVRYSAGAAWIATVGLDGSEPRNLTRITKGGGIRPQPRWIPQSNRIVYVDLNAELDAVLSTVDADGTNQRTITPTGRSYHGPITWSSDSKWLLAQTIRDTWDLIEAETGNVLPLVHTNGYPDASLK